MQITANDARLFFDVHGARLVPDGGRLREQPTIVALHGGPGFDHGYLKPGLAPLADLAQVVYLDQRCQGRSAGPPVETCTLERMADDLAAFCAAVGIERPVVLGHSAGGFVALIAALRHPGLAAALALCDTAPALDLGTAGPPEAVVREGGPAAVEAMARVFGGDASPDAMAAFVELVAPLYFHPARRHLLPEVLPLSSFDAAVSNYFWTRLAARYDVRAGLSRIAAPTLVVVGDHDWVCPPVAAREVATAIPGAELVEVARSGHFPFSERPEAFHAAIASFLETRVTSETAAAGQAIPSRTWNSSTTDGVRSCARSRTGRR